MEQLRDARGLTEQEAIARYKSRNYPRPALTADIVIFRKEADGYSLLLVRRGGHPYLGKWAFPGGFANENEPTEVTAARELQEETGLHDQPLMLAQVASAPGRDPRGWIVSVVYCAILSENQIPKAGDDAAAVRWFQLQSGPEGLRLFSEDDSLSPEDLAFDHGEILLKTIQKAGISL